MAAPIASAANPMATNATLTGSYSVGYIDPTFPGDALFTMTADGQGNIGNVSVTAYTGSNATAVTQSLSGATYTFTNGAAALKLGGTRNSSTLVAGDELLYISPDGNFIFGGNYSGYDMFVGVRAATSPPTNFAGLYYQAGLDMNESATFNGFVSLEQLLRVVPSALGKNDRAQENEQRLAHELPKPECAARLRRSRRFHIFRLLYLEQRRQFQRRRLQPALFVQHRWNHSHRIWHRPLPFPQRSDSGASGRYLSDSGVYLNPVGVVNAASSAPFTAQVSPGEFLTLYGSGLAPTTATASLPFPSLFNGVQVLINSVAAPIYYLSPTQISVIVPYGTTANSVAHIYVANNGTNSNLVTQFTGLTARWGLYQQSGGRPRLRGRAASRLFGDIASQPGARSARPWLCIWRGWAR